MRATVLDLLRAAWKNPRTRRDHCLSAGGSGRAHWSAAGSSGKEKIGVQRGRPKSHAEDEPAHSHGLNSIHGASIGIKKGTVMHTYRLENCAVTHAQTPHSRITPEALAANRRSGDFQRFSATATTNATPATTNAWLAIPSRTAANPGEPSHRWAEASGVNCSAPATRLASTEITQPAGIIASLAKKPWSYEQRCHADIADRIGSMRHSQASSNIRHSRRHQSSPAQEEQPRRDEPDRRRAATLNIGIFGIPNLAPRSWRCLPSP